VLFKRAFGIDYRTNRLILILLEKSLGGVKVLNYSTHELPPEEEKEEREARVIGAINEFVAKNHIRKERVFLSVPREKVIARFIRLPVATRENLRQVVEYEVPKFTPFKSSEVYFDYILLREDKDWLTLYSVFIKRSEIESILSLLKKIGIRPIAIQTSSISALNLFLWNKKPERGEYSILIDFNDPFFEIHLLQGKDWQENYHLFLPESHWFSEVKRILHLSGLESPSQPSLSFYIYGIDKEKRRGEGISGGESKFFSPPIHKIKNQKDPDFLWANYSSIGLPLSGLIKTPLTLNLLPVEMWEKKRKIGRVLLLILLGVAILFGANRGIKAYLDYRQEWFSTTEELKKLKPEVEAIERLQKRKESLMKEIAEFERIRLDEISKIEILKELTQLLPETAWIWNLKYKGKEIEISGFADSASDLISLLDKSPLFEKVEFLAPVTKERLIRPEGPQEKERFRIRAKIETRRIGP